MGTPTDAKGNFIPPPLQQCTFLSWPGIEQMVEELAAQVSGAAGDDDGGGDGGGDGDGHPSSPPPFDAILGITRGGLVPASLLAQCFELRNVLTATVIFYDDAGKTFYGMMEPRFLSFPDDRLIEGKRVLVVDDVFDSGRTARSTRLRCARAGAASVSVAVLHYKPERNAFGEAERPAYYARETSDWIVYPWEKLSPSGIEAPARDEAHRQHGGGNGEEADGQESTNSSSSSSQNARERQRRQRRPDVGHRQPTTRLV